MATYKGEVLELGATVPELRPIAFDRPILDLTGKPQYDDQGTLLSKRVTVEGYVDMDACPGRIRANVIAARRRYQEREFPEGEIDSEGWIIVKRELLQAVIPRGLTFDEADEWAGGEKGFLVLSFLGWLKTPDEEEQSQDPEASGESPSTGDGSSPTSTSSTEQPEERDGSMSQETS